MKTLHLLACLVLAPLAALAQNQNVTQQIANKRVNSDIVIGSGRAFTVESGGSITINSGATTSGLLSNAALAPLSTGIMRVSTSTGAIGSVNTSSGLASLLSDETGTGGLVFATAPSLAGPLVDFGLFTEASAPSTPASGRVALYAKADGLLYSKDDAGTETLVSGGSGGGGGIGGSTGSTDNALLRANGTGGATAQASTITVDDTGAVTIPEMSAPSTPASGKVVFYAKTDGKIYAKDDAGTETELGGGGMTNPMTTAGDIITGGSSGTPQRKGVGSEGQVLKIVSGVPDWAADSTGSGSLPGSPSEGDITYFDGADWVSLPIGTEAQVLQVSGGVPLWGAGSGGGGTALFMGRAAKTSAYTIVSGDKGYLIDATSGSFTITLDNAATLTSGFFVGVTNSGTGSVTLATTSSEVIRGPLGGVTSVALGRGQSYILFCDGTKFIVTANAGVTGPTSSTNGRLALWDGASGGVIRDTSTVTVSGDNFTFSGTANFYVTGGDFGFATQYGGKVINYFGTYTFRAGDSSLYPRVGGVAYSNITPAGNVGSGEDALITRTTAGSVLDTNGMRYRVRAAFTLAANGNNKRIRAKFGSTTYYDSGAVAANAGSVVIEAVITRTGSSAQNISATVVSSNALLPTTAVVTTATETSGSGNDILFTGEATSDNDIVQQDMLIEFLPAP